MPEGERILQVSADNLLFGICTLVLQVKAGETLYFDASPRPANIAAGAAGAVVAGMPGGTAGQIVEGAGPGCQGPYRLVPLEPSVALGHLERRAHPSSETADRYTWRSFFPPAMHAEIHREIRAAEVSRT